MNRDRVLIWILFVQMGWIYGEAYDGAWGEAAVAIAITWLAGLLVGNIVEHLWGDK